ncbi:hypothetical protein D1872_270390 [compost metagenome]
MLIQRVVVPQAAQCQPLGAVKRLHAATVQQFERRRPAIAEQHPDALLQHGETHIEGMMHAVTEPAAVPAVTDPPALPDQRQRTGEFKVRGLAHHPSSN